MATSWSCAPIILANFSRTLAISPIQISYHACAPHSLHISMNCASPCIERCESAPSEQLFKYVLRCKIGNSERYATSSGCSIATGAVFCILDSLVVIGRLLLIKSWLFTLHLTANDAYSTFYFTVFGAENLYFSRAISRPAPLLHSLTISPASNAAHRVPARVKGPSPSGPARDQCFLHDTPSL